jgi:hypothetical protein
MSVVTAVHLRDLRLATERAYQAARANAQGAAKMVEAAWANARAESAAAIDDDAAAEVVRKYAAIFTAFASFDMDENTVFAVASSNVGPGAPLSAKQREILGKRPALADYMVDLDERDVQLQARADRHREAVAERVSAELPAKHLARIRAAGFDLLLDAKGHLLASPGAPLDQGFGVAIYTERKAEFVAILKAEADAAAAVAKRLAPVVIA